MGRGGGKGTGGGGRGADGGRGAGGGMGGEKEWGNYCPLLDLNPRPLEASRFTAGSPPLETGSS